jgi:Uma2 family endonuclease
LKLDLDLEGGGQMTFKSSLLKRGLEPDNCFWIQGDDPARGATEWIDGVHRAPDLAIEITVSRGVVNRLEIFAKLGVPELWVFDGTDLQALERVNDETYRPIERSIAFPFLTLDSLVPFLLADATTRQNTILKQFLAWVETQDFPGASHS